VSAAHTIVFTGHRIDKPGRKEPRFPADKEQIAATEIGAAIDTLAAEHGGNVLGVSGAASGGDILFHEACIARGIPSLVYLALPPDEFAERSVNDAGEEWTRRYYALLEQCPVHVLPEGGDKTTLWVRNTLWILERGLANGGENMTLLALWDGKGGDGAGGTEDMVNRATERGAKVVRIGMRTIFG
jgi:hypothetical protein